MPSMSDKTLSLCPDVNPCTIFVRACGTIFVRACGNRSFCIDLMSKVGNRILCPHLIQMVYQQNKHGYEIYRREGVTVSCGVKLVEDERCVVE